MAFDNIDFLISDIVFLLTDSSFVGPVLRTRAFGTSGLKFVSIGSTEKHNVDTLYFFYKRNSLQ